MKKKSILEIETWEEAENLTVADLYLLLTADELTYKSLSKTLKVKNLHVHAHRLDDVQMGRAITADFDYDDWAGKKVKEGILFLEARHNAGLLK